MASTQYNGFKQIKQSYGDASLITELNPTSRIVDNISTGVDAYRFDKPIISQMDTLLGDNDCLIVPFSVLFDVINPGAECLIWDGSRWDASYLGNPSNLVVSILNPLIFVGMSLDLANFCQVRFQYDYTDLSNTSIRSDKTSYLRNFQKYEWTNNLSIRSYAYNDIYVRASDIGLDVGTPLNRQYLITGRAILTKII